MIITQTPFRVSFAGGGTDLPAFYEHEPGAVLSVGVNHHMYITVSPRFEDTTRIAYSKVEIAENVDAIEHTIVREALRLTGELGRSVYWSRSRQKLWYKGEESGHVQVLKDIRLDCDNDVILLEVEQLGGIACHTGRHSCFYRRLENGQWVDLEAPIKDPTEIYKKGS